jgi:uncharacterized membrane protein YjgN (DUF898 family)
MDLETAPPASAIASYQLRFTGDGGVYFGVWMVNLLLMVVTLGLFTPFARRRNVKYFYAHSDIAGSPLEFTGGLRRMFLGYLMFFGLYLAYSIASHTEQNVVAVTLALAWMVLSPWLWASAVRFRTVSTRWRGIRGEFQASWRETYAASAPMLLFAGVAGAGGMAAGLLDLPRPAPHWIGLGVLAFLAVSLWVLVRQEYNYARLRVLRTSFGGHSGRWQVPFGALLKITALAVAFFLAIVAVIAGLVATAAAVAGGGMAMFGKGKEAIVLMIVVGIFGSFFAFYLAAGPALAWREARKFALVWNNTALGTAARFSSNLRSGAFVKLRIRNMLLTMVTMGFWRPFAITSEYAMKLDSVTLHVEGGLDQLVGQMLQRQPGTVGDAVADAIGFDMVG